MAFTATYVNLSVLLSDSVFLNRVTMAIVNYAKYILGENASTPFHTARMEWAKQAVLNPQLYTPQLRYLVAVDPQFSNQSTVPIDPNSINDTQMDAVVQTAIDNSILKF